MLEAAAVIALACLWGWVFLAPLPSNIVDEIIALTERLCAGVLGTMAIGGVYGAAQWLG